MRWEDSRRSDNIEDVRGDSYSSAQSGGSMVGGGGLGIGTMLVLGLIALFFGVDPRVLIGGAQVVSNVAASRSASQPPLTQQHASGKPQDKMGDFVAAVVGENEDVWSEVLPQQTGVQFQPARLVMFTGATRSACGKAQTATGPFYCPLDRKIYLDTSFFEEMRRKLGGGGEFADAYVISHEMGHHIENLMGILPKVQRAQQEASSDAEVNALSVGIELMADCLAGVWAANADKKWRLLQDGDIEQAINTAAAIGDDRLSRGMAPVDAFTHGSSRQRMDWLKRGLQSGRIVDCNTFRR